MGPAVPHPGEGREKETMRDGGERHGIATTARPWPAAAMAIIFAVLAACSAPPPTAKPAVQTTRAFDAVYGELPPIPLQAPACATVVYFPAAKAPGRYLTAPIFTTEEGKAEFLTVRTAVRGIDQEEFARQVRLPFPKGSDLISFHLEYGKAMIRLGGTFRADLMSKKEGGIAAASLFLTAKQFGEVSSIEITDAGGKAVFDGRPSAAQAADPGDPRVLGLLAVREQKGKPPTALSVLFDRPVFVEEIAFFPPGGDSPFPGKSYATGFGMSVEFHPDPAVVFDTENASRIRFKVRDGKGRTAEGDLRWIPKEVVRG
jgi:germination protein M